MEALDVNGAAKKISSLLSEPQEAESNESTEEAMETSPEDDTQTDTPDPEEEEIHSDTSDTLEDADTESDVELFKVKVDGEELEVDRDELIKGYQLETNYRKKVNELNQERESLEARKQDIDKALEEAESLVELDELDLNSPEMLELKEYDRDEYYDRKEKIEARRAKFEKIKSERKAELESKKNSLIQKERQMLLENFPQWESDAELATKESTEFMKIMQDFGYSTDELNNLTDHRQFLIAKELKELRDIKKANIEAKAVKTKPKTVKPGSQTSSSDRRSTMAKQQRAKVKKTGNLRDAAALLGMRN